MTDPQAIHAEMLRLENDFHAEGRPNEVPIDEVIAELGGVADLSMEEFDRFLGDEVQRALDLALTHYANAARTPHMEYMLTAVGFLQGVTFARAVRNLTDDRAELLAALADTLDVTEEEALEILQAERDDA